MSKNADTFGRILLLSWICFAIPIFASENGAGGENQRSEDYEQKSDPDKVSTEKSMT